MSTVYVSHFLDFIFGISLSRYQIMTTLEITVHGLTVCSTVRSQEVRAAPFHNNTLSLSKFRNPAMPT